MHGKYNWALAALAWYGVLALAHRTALVTLGDGPVFPWLYGAGYLVFGVVLLGALARWWHHGSAALWRPAMLSLGSLAAAVEIALLPRAAAAEPVDQWMVALLGLVGAALLVRVATPALNHRWLGVDRRGSERGA
jgi:hypothetical protein